MILQSTPTGHRDPLSQKWLLGGLAFVMGLMGMICGAFLLIGIGYLFSEDKPPVALDESPIPTATPTAPVTSTPSPAPSAIIDPDPDNFIITTGGWGTFDPAINYDTGGQGIFANTYETLVTYDREDPSTLLPQLASDYQVSSDGRTYTFTIREGIRFHEGGELTASDVAYSFQRRSLMGGPDSPQILFTEPFFGVGKHHFLQDIDPYLPRDIERVRSDESGQLITPCEQIKSAIQADGNTVTITLAQPWSPFLATLAGGWASIMDQEWVINNGGWDGDCTTWQRFYSIANEDNPFHSRINGTGPYKLQQGSPGSKEIVLVANENYWRNEETGPAWAGGPIGPPAIGRIAIKNVTQDTSFAMLLDGDVDQGLVSGDNYAQLDQLVGELCEYNFEHRFECEILNPDAPLRLYSGFPETSRTDAVFIFNINNQGGNPFIGSGQLDGNGIPTNFFSDIHVRRAFNYCFDWQRYIEQVYGGQAIQAVGPIIPSVLGYNANGPKYEFDLETCSQELELAWGGQVAQNGFRMTLVNYGLGIAENLRDNLAQVDSRYVIEIIEFSDLPDTFNYGQQAADSRLPLAIRFWKEDIHDPHNWVQPWLVGLMGGAQKFPLQWAEEEFGKLIDQGAITTNPEERQAIYESLTQLDYDKAIAIRLAVPFGRRYEQRWVKGWYYNPAHIQFYFYALEK